MEQEDYPEDFEQFIVRFATEQDCYDYISKIRWANSFTCPRCCSSNYWWKTNKRPLMVCASCGLQTSITAGTIFQGTRKPLRLWFHVMWWMMSQKTGASAKNLQHTMGFKRYETAWTWLHKLRHAMIRPGRDRLKGAVEVEVVSLIKRWLMGTHQGAVSQKYLSEYLDEYAFRFNRRLSTHRGKLFYRLMQQAVSTEPTFRQDIVS